MDDALEVLTDSLELTDAIRADCARLQQRCTELERELRGRHAAVQQLLDQLPVAVIDTDATGRILHVNAAAARLLGRSAANLRDGLLLHFFEDREAFSSLTRRLREATKPVQVTMRFRPLERAPFEAVVTVTADPRADEPRWAWCLERAGVRQEAVRRSADAAISA